LDVEWAKKGNARDVYFIRLDIGLLFEFESITLRHHYR